ncbi:type II secretion system protein [Jeongeupia chitinilytica]|uniref:Prepilin-type N-terminal cleavage/methylation domain-containing protein n=1 Tax=Jeongeupia chitinilytica TaxID=1041641 RepID=A0ABQ3GYP1_9NEIS|nr:prepilin-type N-terminal cleavage/methylation domain-containing protein [Jeongeupia chitinilytica]GHD61711.1 hypothetical protein GCM10007350_16480 [Jeongeupia chitinilytica]
MKCTNKQGGFTLVELAIVLVIVGLILGLAFKGRDLIDGARVKSAQASTNKIQAAVNVYFERYNAVPGDGCPTATPANQAACNGARNGLVDGATEPQAFWQQLVTNSTILTASERNTPFGVQWNVLTSAAAANSLAGNVSYLIAGPDATTASVDVRYVCSLDQQYDDGVRTTGNIRSTGVTYNASTDCWRISGLATLAVRLLP